MQLKKLLVLIGITLGFVLLHNSSATAATVSANICGEIQNNRSIGQDNITVTAYEVQSGAVVGTAITAPHQMIAGSHGHYCIGISSSGSYILQAASGSKEFRVRWSGNSDSKANATPINVSETGWVTGSQAGIIQLIQETRLGGYVTSSLVSSVPLPNVYVQIQDGYTVFSTYTNSSGFYEFVGLPYSSAGWKVKFSCNYCGNPNSASTPIGTALYFDSRYSVSRVEQYTFTLVSASIGAGLSPTNVSLKPFYRTPPTITVSGVPAAGETVTGLVSCQDGASASYQWRRLNAYITGATANTYTIQAADIGYALVLEGSCARSGYISSSSAGGFGTGVVVTGGIFSSTPAPTIPNEPIVGATVSASYTEWGTSPKTTNWLLYDFQWLKNGVAIPGATKDSYLITEADLGSQIAVSMTGRSPGYASVTKTSSSVSPIRKWILKGRFDLQGQMTVGSTLSLVETGTWDVGTTFTFEWLRNSVPISGASSKTYTLTAQDLNKTVNSRVTASQSGLTPVVQFCGGEPYVLPATSTFVPETPIISGATSSGSTLEMKLANWDTGYLQNIQWLRNGTPIPGANSVTYALAASDIGYQISVRVTGQKIGYSDASSISAATQIVTKPSFSGGSVLIVGNKKVGEILKAEISSFSPSPAGTNFQWYRNGLLLSGETAPTYKLKNSDAGYLLLGVQVTVSYPGYDSKMVSSYFGEIVSGGVIKPAEVSIKGQNVVGGSLNLLEAGWSGCPVLLSYQWKANNLLIPGANSSTFQISEDLLGKTISAEVTANCTGFESVKSQATLSSPVDSTNLKVLPLPLSLRILGEPTQGKTLRVEFSNPNSIQGTVAYQWLRSGSPISGATSATYTTSNSDIGLNVVASVTFNSLGYLPFTAKVTTSQPISALSVVGGVTLPKIISAGTTVTATPSGWSSGAFLQYQWTVNGVDIPGAKLPIYQAVHTGVPYTLGVRVWTVSSTGVKSQEVFASSAVQATSIQRPSVSALNRSTSRVGSLITISGTALQATTKIYVGSVIAKTFKVLSDTSISVKIPKGAKSGYVTVYGKFGKATSPRKIVITK